MALFDRSALHPGVAPREVGAWAMYDFANSGYTTVVLTAVFNAYFVSVVAERAEWATLAWTLALAVSNTVVMVTMPAIGAWADQHAAKKPLMLAATLGCIVSTAALAGVGRGDVAAAMVMVAISNACFSFGEALAAAFLPELARPEALGRVSGWGWSVGYFGGMLSLGLSLAWVIAAQGRGESAEQFVPPTLLIVAAVFALAALPAFVVLRERAVPKPACAEASSGVGAALRQVATTVRAARRYRDFWQLMRCGAAYQAGISVVIALAAVYAEAAMGFQPPQTMMLVFLVNIAAALGAFAFGYAQDRIGHKAALAWTLAGWILMIAIAGFTRSVAMFWLAAAIAGLCMGSSQSCGRAMVGHLAPLTQRAEFFGLWALATRLSAVVGPLAYGLVTWLSDGNHRLAILATGGFFMLGLLLLRGLDIERGVAAARDSDAAVVPARSGA